MHRRIASARRRESVSSTSADNRRELQLVGAVIREHGGNGPKHDLEVQADGPIADVVQIEANHVFERDLAPSADLPEAGHPGHRLKSAELPLLVLVDLGWERRSWADQTHVTAQDVEQLRQLIETEAAKEAAHT